MTSVPTGTLPFTEQHNPLCHDLDGALSPTDFLRTIQSADAQIFGGYQGQRSLWSSEIRATLTRATSAASDILTASQGVLIHSGCGTSGRIGFLTARRYSNLLGEAIGTTVGYCCAGGDSALLLSDEMPEDDPAQGVADMHAASLGRPMCLVGITCGLSAPYVAGQVAALVENAGGGVAVLVGFNPVPLSRGAPMKSPWKNGRPAAFRDVAMAVEKSDRHYVLNPVVGPEPVAGSSRMKGGTATLVIADVMTLRALHAAGRGERLPFAGASVETLLAEYQRAHTLTYAAIDESLPAVMASAAHSLREGGRLLYLGAGSAGCLAFIDASEMPDTYGASFDQTRAFIAGGWRRGACVREDISGKSRLHRIGLDHFQDDIVTTLTSRDTVVVVVAGTISESEATELRKAAQAAATAGATLSSLTSRGSGTPVFDLQLKMRHLRLDVELPSSHEGFLDLAIKIMTNAVSTYAQGAGRGALFKGRMIAAAPANDKIYQRCIHLISEYVKVSPHHAEVAMVRSIYGLDEVSDELMSRPREDHIRASIAPEDQRGIAQVTLPVAFLLAVPHGQWRTFAEAQRAVRAEPQLSTLLKRALEGDRRKDLPKSIVGVDLGGTNIRTALVNSVGKIVSDISRLTIADTDRSPEAVLDLVLRSIQNLHLAEDAFDVIAVGQPGFVGPDGTVSKFAAFPEWENRTLPLAAFLRKAFKGKAVYVFDDANCALAGEVRFGSARLVHTAAILTVGTGIGSGLYLHGAKDIHRGARGLIEIGHSIVVPDGLQCSCGQRGCLEMYASGAAIAARGGIEVPGVLDEAAKALAVGCINLCRSYDPDVVVFAGGVAATVLPLVRKHIRDLVWRLHDDAAEIPLSLAACMEPGLQGAAALAFQCMERAALSRQPRELPSSWRLRHATMEDLPGLYKVCLKTGDGGEDGTHMFSNPDLLGEIFVGPYVTLSPAFAFALINDEDNGAVCGYVLGVSDTSAFSRNCEAKWWPPLREKYTASAMVSYCPNERRFIADYIAAKGQPPYPSVVEALLTEYPSHMHIDLLPHAQRQGLGTVMVGRLLDALRGAGSSGVHLVQQEKNERAFAFYTKLGFTLAAKNDTDLILTKVLS